MSRFQPYEMVAADPAAPGRNILIVADHASNHIPAGIDLGVPDDAMARHIAIDIGVDAVARLLCASLGCGAVLARVSRLVIDFNREEDADGLVPLTSDGVMIPGNVDADIEARLAAYYRPYHAAVTSAINGTERPFILSLHSFTPSLAARPDEQRPWDMGILYNQDNRAACLAIPILMAAGLNIGDQLPYSGAILNATMNRHAEARAIPYLGVEMRQDHVASPEGAARMAGILSPVIAQCSNSLA